MAKTIQEILVDVAEIFRSTIDPDDVLLSNKNEEEFKNVISSCKTEAKRLLNDNDFDFTINTYNFKTQANKQKYRQVDGQVVKNGICIEGNTTPLRFEVNGNLLREQTGRPSKFWFDKSEKIILYPTPDDAYNVYVKYKDMRYFLDENLVPQLEPEPTYTLNMPERLQGAFIDWLKYETLANYLRNEAKPRFQPTINKAEQLRLAFLKLANAYEEEASLLL